MRVGTLTYNNIYPERYRRGENVSYGETILCYSFMNEASCCFYNNNNLVSKMKNNVFAFLLELRKAFSWLLTQLKTTTVVQDNFEFYSFREKFRTKQLQAEFRSLL